MIGFSLIEICIVISILAALCAFGLPSFNLFLMRQERKNTLQTLQNAIHCAQMEAHNKQKIFSLCPSKNKLNCSSDNDWSEGFILFERDAQASVQKTSNTNTTAIDTNRTTNTTNKIIRPIQAFSGVQYGRLSFSAQIKRLDILPNGMTNQMGSFLYEPYKYNSDEMRRLIINRAGRLRITTE